MRAVQCLSFAFLGCGDTDEGLMLAEGTTEVSNTSESTSSTSSDAASSNASSSNTTGPNASSSSTTGSDTTAADTMGSETASSDADTTGTTGEPTTSTTGGGESTGGPFEGPYSPCPGGDADCPDGEICITEGGIGHYCTPECMTTDECAVPLSGDAQLICVYDSSPAIIDICALLCTIGTTTCPDNMECTEFFEGNPYGACMWPN